MIVFPFVMPPYQEDSFVADFIARPNLFHFQDSKTAFLELLGKAERYSLYSKPPKLKMKKKPTHTKKDS